MSANPVYKIILLLFCIASVISCKTTEFTGSGSSRDPSFIPYHTTANKNTANAYRQFIGRYARSPYADEAKTKLAKLLVEERDKNELEDFAQKFPTHKYLVADVLAELRTIAKINEHLQTNIPSGARVRVRPGEIICGRTFFKAYIGREEWEGERMATYSIRVENISAPEFIKVELLTDLSFVMVEKFDALVNIYYEIKISSATPPGEYQATAIVGAYQSLSPDEEYRKGGKEVGFTIEVEKTLLNSAGALELDFEAVSYFKQKQEEVQTALDELKTPEIDAFGTRYMSKYNSANHNIRLTEYRLSQAKACYHLQQAAKSPQPEIASKAQSYIDRLQKNKLFSEYKPVK